MQYMRKRHRAVGELGRWTSESYSMRQQVDSHTCGVLAFMSVEAALNVSVIDSLSSSVYHRYIKTHLINNTDNDITCNMPNCVEPTGKLVKWPQCDQCSRWCPKVCANSTYIAIYTADFCCAFCKHL